MKSLTHYNSYYESFAFRMILKGKEEGKPYKIKDNLQKCLSSKKTSFTFNVTLPSLGIYKAAFPAYTIRPIIKSYLEELFISDLHIRDILNNIPYDYEIDTISLSVDICKVKNGTIYLGELMGSQHYDDVKDPERFAKQVARDAWKKYILTQNGYKITSIDVSDNNDFRANDVLAWINE